VLGSRLSVGLGAGAVGTCAGTTTAGATGSVALTASTTAIISGASSCAIAVFLAARLADALGDTFVTLAFLGAAGFFSILSKMRDSNKGDYFKMRGAF
jgi:hypothetical protein